MPEHADRNANVPLYMARGQLGYERLEPKRRPHLTVSVPSMPAARCPATEQ